MRTNGQSRAQWTKYFLHSNGQANTLSGNGTLSSAEPRVNRLTVILMIQRSRSDSLPIRVLRRSVDLMTIARSSNVLMCLFTRAMHSRKTWKCGPLRVHLSAASSARDTDFMAKLIDVWPNGFAQRLNDGMVRARFREGMDKPSLIEPGRVYSYDLDLWNTCQLYQKGHRIRVEVSSSAYPKYDRNLNTGEALGQTTRMAVAQQKIYHDREHPSFVILPIVPRPTSVRPN